MAPLALVAHPMRIAHIQRLHTLGTAELHHLPRPLVPQVAHPAFFLAAFARPCVLQAAPALGAFLAVGLQARELTQRLVVLPFNGAHAPSGDNESLARVSRHRRLMDLAQIDTCLY